VGLLLCVVGRPATAFFPSTHSRCAADIGAGIDRQPPRRSSIQCLSHSPLRPAAASKAAAADRSITNNNNNNEEEETPPRWIQWHVYVDQSKASIDKGAAATLDAFIGLAPPGIVQVHAAIFQSIPTKVKGPVVRCVELLYHDSSGSGGVEDTDHDTTTAYDNCRSFEVANVDSVDKVARILRKHMNLSPAVGGGSSTAESLKWKYQGTSHLEKGKINLAIDCYDRALETSNDGILFLLRAAAYLERAAGHREQLRESVQLLTEAVDLGALQAAVVTAGQNDITLANPIFQRILQVTSQQEAQFRRTQYRHGMYQYALLQAAQDAFRATQLLPRSADAWRRAADILSELWKLKEAVQYYEKAMELDDSIDYTANIQQLYKRQDLLESARAYGWSEDTLRLALDVAR
jgi:PAS domain-containing protein